MPGITAEQPAWGRCADCQEWWCNLHQKHVFECDCPPIEEWAHDPYEPRATLSITNERDATK